MAVGTALNSYAEAVHAANALGADSLLGERPLSCKNSKLRFEMIGKIPSETEGKSSRFSAYGMAVK
jgi:hypothetical protein